jgi:hypothetical protein
MKMASGCGLEEAKEAFEDLKVRAVPFGRDVCQGFCNRGIPTIGRLGISPQGSIVDSIHDNHDIKARKIPLDVARFLALKDQFFELNAEYRKRITHLHSLKKDNTEFMRLEELKEDLKPLEENWNAWLRVAEICDDINFIPAEESSSPNTNMGG